MATTTIDAERVQQVWDWCSEIYLRHGRKISFPAKTDKTKTYQWRYITSLAKKFDEWEFDEQTAKKFIDTTIRHVQKLGITHKGLSAFHQKNLLEICYKELLKECNTNSRIETSLRKTHHWLTTNVIGDLPSVLIQRKNRHSLCNLTIWFQSGMISVPYLALSRACSIALSRLAKQNSDERLLLPPTEELFSLRRKLNAEIITIPTILRDDWRKP